MSYPCPFPLCGITEDSITLLQVHCMSIHTRDFTTCPWCTLPFSGQRMLQIHATQCRQLDENGPRESEVNAVYIQGSRCAPCESQFVSNEAAIKHYKEQHLNYRYVCEQCERCFTVYSNLERHYADGHPRAGTSAEALHGSPSMAMPSSSTNANESTTSSVSNQVHSTHLHPRQKKMLSKLPRAEWNLYRKAFQAKRCYGCNNEFDTIDNITQHFATDHQTKVYPCRECNRVYVSRHSLRAHKCPRGGLSSPPNRRLSVFINSEQNMPADEILSCPMLLCGFRTTSNQRFITHLLQSAHFPREAEVKLEKGALLIPEDRIKTEPVDQVRLRPPFRQMRETRGMNASGIVDLTLDSENEDN